jgi:hypothetical protein
MESDFGRVSVNFPSSPNDDAKVDYQMEALGPLGDGAYAWAAVTVEIGRSVGSSAIPTSGTRRLPRLRPLSKLRDRPDPAGGHGSANGELRYRVR